MDERAGPGEAAAGGAPARLRRRMVWLGGVAVAVAVVAGVTAWLLVLGNRSGSTDFKVGPGISSSVADQVKGEFPDDQAALYKALTDNDAGAAQGRVTGSSLQELVRQVTDDRNRGVRLRTVVHPTSTELLQEGDPNDPGVTVEVHQVGTHHQDVLGRSGDVATSSQDLSSDYRYWLRPVNGHYAITDIVGTAQPVSPATPFPWWAVAAGGAVLVVALALLLLWLRHRRLAPVRAPGPPVPVPAPLVSAVAMPAWAGPGDGKETTLGIRTIGGFQLWWQGEDLAEEILRRPNTGFVWTRLLVLAIDNPAALLPRSDAREEAAPRVDITSQQGRLRQVVQEFKALPPILRDRMVVTRHVMSFDLGGCEVDAVEILKLGRELRGGAAVDPARLAHASAVLASTTGEFLPTWRDIVSKATDVDSPATETVSELRQRLEIARADILVAIGDDHLTRHEPGPAVEAFEEALRLREERGDIAERLIAALLAAGRQGEADRVRGDYGPSRT